MPGAASLAPASASTASASAPERPDLRQAFEAAWARQPEASSLQARRSASDALKRAAQGWSPEPPSLNLAAKTDRLTRDRGVRELELGVSVPLWLPGERQSSAALADAEATALDSRQQAARLRLAARVRDAWWAWHRSLADATVARDHLQTARRLAADVALRVAAGELARADQHRADGLVAAAESDWALVEWGVMAAGQQFKALAGAMPAGSALSDASAAHVGTAATPSSGDAVVGSEVPPPAALAITDAHALLQELRDRLAVAERAVALAASQSRAHREIALAVTRDRSGYGDAYGQTVTLGLRIPFGGGPQHEAKLATARAEAAEAVAQLALERERLAAEAESAGSRVEAARLQWAAAERRAQLARETQGFVDKSFRLGESDLPTRLRVQAEALEAERQSARSRIEVASAISALRQSLGLLPQ